MIIFRGDRFERVLGDNNFNNSLPTAGLFPNGINGGNPYSLAMRSDVEGLVLKHVNPKVDHEKRYKKRSDFLSFSASLHKACEFALNKTGGVLEEVNDIDKANYCVAALTLKETDLVNVKPGVYHYYYECNRGRILPSRNPEKDNELTFRYSTAASLMRSMPCPSCREGLFPHKLVIINPVEYVRNPACSEDEYKRFLYLAADAQEWLVCPETIIQDAGSKRFFSSCILPPADIWTFKYYIKAPTGGGPKRNRN